MNANFKKLRQWYWTLTSSMFISCSYHYLRQLIQKKQLLFWYFSNKNSSNSHVWERRRCFFVRNFKIAKTWCWKSPLKSNNLVFIVIFLTMKVTNILRGKVSLNQCWKILSWNSCIWAFNPFSCKLWHPQYSWSSSFSEKKAFLVFW